MKLLKGACINLKKKLSLLMPKLRHETRSSNYTNI